MTEIWYNAAARTQYESNPQYYLLRDLYKV